MKGRRAVLVTAALLSLEALYPAGIHQQVTTTPEELARLWKGQLKEYPPWTDSLELEFRLFFPAEGLSTEGVFLWQPHGIACDADGNIYISDAKQKCLFKFDPQGRFLLKKGREGQGPGDFLNPYCLCVSGRTVVVGDTIKRDVQLFDLDLNLVRSFKVPRSYYNLVVGREGLIFAAPIRMSSDQPLVDVLGEGGVFKYSFGEPMFVHKDKWQVPNFVRLDIDARGDVLLAFQHMAIVRRYSAQGELQAAYQIEHKGMKVAERMNLINMNAPGNRGYRPTIFAIRAKEDGFFLLHNYPIVEVLEFDRAGRPLKDYWVARSYDFHAFDFLVKGHESDGRLEFVLLQMTDNRIEVYQPKKAVFKDR